VGEKGLAVEDDVDERDEVRIRAPGEAEPQRRDPGLGLL